MMNGVLGRARAYYLKIKRIADFGFSVITLLMISPLLLIVGVAVIMTSKGPVLFWSHRRGLEGRMFLMPKFRTMTIGSKVMSREIASDKDVSLTPIGQFLRKTSLDELPQFLSVVKGDMSLIGPRPLLINDYARGQREKYPEIYSVRPGITGLAQVNGRSFITPKNKIRYDAFYANHVCMILDLKILIRTLGTVFNTKLVR